MQTGTNRTLSVAHICHKALSVLQKCHQNWPAAGSWCPRGPVTADRNHMVKCPSESHKSNPTTVYQATLHTHTLTTV